MLARLNFEDAEMWHSVVGLLVFGVAFYFIAYLLLRFLGRERFLPITSNADAGKSGAQRRVNRLVGPSRHKIVGGVQPEVITEKVDEAEVKQEATGNADT